MLSCFHFSRCYTCLNKVYLTIRIWSFDLKLRLESNSTNKDLTILAITGPITAENIPVLKAGLTKMAQSGKKQIILDMSEIKEKDCENAQVMSEIDQLSKWAKEENFDLLVATLISSVGDVPTRKQAVEVFSSELCPLLLQETLIKSELRRIKTEKLGYEERLQRLRSEEVKSKQFRKDTSDLSKYVKDLEDQIESLLEKRGTNESSTWRLRRDEIEKVAVPILLQKGLIKA